MTKTTQRLGLIIWYFSACVLRHELLSSEVMVVSEGIFFPICVGNSIEVTCTTTTTILGWQLDYPSGSPVCETVYFLSMSSRNVTICNVSCELLSYDPYTSVATLASVGSDDNGAVLTCLSTLAGMPQPDEMANITLSIQDPPSAPLSPEIFPLSLTSVIMSWTPPTLTLCVTNYSITLTNITEGNVSYIYNTIINSTSKTVSDLTQGAQYSFNVAGVDTGGRVGEKSMSAELITLDTPQNVTGLKSIVTGDVITIIWMPPPPSTRPPVTRYKISHNTTGSMLVNLTNDTEFTVEGEAPGIYLFTIVAVNILGDGEVGLKEIVTVVDGAPVTRNSEVIETNVVTTSSFRIMKTTIVFISSTSSNNITPTNTEEFGKGSLLLTIGLVIGGCIVITVISLLALLGMKIGYTRAKRKQQNFSQENEYASQEQVVSEYAEISMNNMTRMAVNHSRPTIPYEEINFTVANGEFMEKSNFLPSEVISTYSEVMLVNKCNQVQCSQEDSEYSKLGQTHDQVKPQCLADQEGEYSVLGGVKDGVHVLPSAATASSLSASMEQTIVGDKPDNVPPPLPPESF